MEPSPIFWAPRSSTSAINDKCRVERFGTVASQTRALHDELPGFGDEWRVTRFSKDCPSDSPRPTGSVTSRPAVGLWQ